MAIFYSILNLYNIRNVHLKKYFSRMVWYNGTRCKDRRQNNPGRFVRKLLETDKLQELYYNVTPIKDIASFFNCSIPTIRRHLKFLIPANLRRYKYYYSASNPINQKIVKLYTNHHYSTLKVAELVNLSEETVRRRLMRLGVQLRRTSFKNLETLHPRSFNRIANKVYTICETYLFNQKFLEYYCLMFSMTKIAKLLNIDRGTVKRRIYFLKSLYYFKTRFCKRCNNLFRFKSTDMHKNSDFCTRCSLSRKNKKNHLN